MPVECKVFVVLMPCTASRGEWTRASLWEKSLPPSCWWCSSPSGCRPSLLADLLFGPPKNSSCRVTSSFSALPDDSTMPSYNPAESQTPVQHGCSDLVEAQLPLSYSNCRSTGPVL